MRRTGFVDSSIPSVLFYLNRYCICYLDLCQSNLIWSFTLEKRYLYYYYVISWNYIVSQHHLSDSIINILTRQTLSIYVSNFYQQLRHYSWTWTTEPILYLHCCVEITEFEKRYLIWVRVSLSIDFFSSLNQNHILKINL